MKFICPNCHETLSLAALIEHDAARDAVRLALEFPAPLAKQMLQYVSLFKPAQRALSMDRFAKIISELIPMISAAQVEYKGRSWSAPQLYWAQAFDAVWASRSGLTLPLTSHGYLIKVIVGYANKAEARHEQKAEQGRQYGELPSLPAQAAQAQVKKQRSEMPPEFKATLDKLTGKNRKAAKDGEQTRSDDSAD